jgi:hypothetical protein
MTEKDLLNLNIQLSLIMLSYENKRITKKEALKKIKELKNKYGTTH